MTQINLLPWREQERQTNKVIFGITLGVFVLLTIVAMLFVHIFYKMEINTQKERSTFLQTTMDQTQADIVGLKDKVEKQVKIMSRLHLIIDLRSKSFQAVRLLNLLISSVPNTITLQKVTRDGKMITIEGVTDSDLQTTLLIRNIAAVKGFKLPVLNYISTQKNESADIVNASNRHFQIKVEQQE